MLADLWPWLAVAGLGALHGLSPATGWMFVAACGVHTRGAARRRHALLAVAIGHAVSVAVVAWAVTQGLSMDRTWARGVAGALLIGAASCRGLRGARPTPSGCAPAGHAGIALWSFLMATAHGAGLMLVPGLVPLCLADNPARAITASGSLALAAAAVAVHTVAMLVTTGLVAAGVCRGIARHPHVPSGAAARQAWTAALGVTGALLLVFR
jgi:hypothetical protein